MHMQDEAAHQMHNNSNVALQASGHKMRQKPPGRTIKVKYTP